VSTVAVPAPPAFSTTEILRRRRLVEDCAAERGLDAVVVYGANRAGSAVPWLTGWPVTREAVVVMRPAAQPVLQQPRAQRDADRGRLRCAAVR
jgi:Xaa-Pro dipeptidase